MLYQLEIPFNRFTPEEVKAIQDFYREHRCDYGFASKDCINFQLWEALKGRRPHTSVMVGRINDMRVLNDYFRFFLVFPDTKEMSMNLMLMYDKGIDENPNYNLKRRYEFRIGDGFSNDDRRPFLNIIYEKEIPRK